MKPQAVAHPAPDLVEHKGAARQHRQLSCCQLGKSGQVGTHAMHCASMHVEKCHSHVLMFSSLLPVIMLWLIRLSQTLSCQPLVEGA